MEAQSPPLLKMPWIKTAECLELVIKEGLRLFLNIKVNPIPCFIQNYNLANQQNTTNSQDLCQTLQKCQTFSFKLLSLDCSATKLILARFIEFFVIFSKDFRALHCSNCFVFCLRFRFLGFIRLLARRLKLGDCFYLSKNDTA